MSEPVVTPTPSVAKSIEAPKVEAPKAEASKKALIQTCQECGFKTHECGGKHVTVNMVPEDPTFRRYYPGHAINGRWYKGHCTVPAPIGADLVAALRRWENDERISRMGRERDIDVTGAYSLVR